MVLLLALLFCCLLDDESSVASEEWFLEDSPTPSSENDRQQCDGQACLLPIASPYPPAAPLPWGSGIRYRVDSGTCTFWILPNANVQLLLELLRRAGPMLCVEHPNDTWPRNRVASDALDVLAYSTFLMSADEETLYPHAQGDVCVVMAREPPRTLTIAYAFTRGTWLLTAAALCAFLVALRATGLHTAEAFLNTFRTFLWGDFPESSHRPPHNALSLLLCVFGVVMVTAFCAKFTSFLAVSSEPPQAQTLEEVDARVSVVYDAAHLQKQAAFFDADDVARRLLAKTVTFESVIEWEALMPLLRAQSGVAFLMSTPKFHMVHRYREWADEATGRSLAHLVPKCVLAPAYLAFPVRRGWPHAARFSARVQAAVEAGLYLRYQW